MQCPSLGKERASAVNLDRRAAVIRWAQELQSMKCLHTGCTAVDGQAADELSHSEDSLACLLNFRKYHGFYQIFNKITLPNPSYAQ